MLLKNDKPWEPGKDFADKLPQENVVFNLSNRYIKIRKPTAERGDRRKRDAPTSFSIDPFYSIPDPESKDGVEVVIRYYKNSKLKNYGNNSVKEYTPDEIEFGSKSCVFIEGDMALYWWLFHHPRQATSPYRDKTKSSFFYLQDPVRDAKEKASKKQFMSKISNLIWGPGDGQLSDSESRQILSSYGTSNVSNLTMDQVRIALEDRAGRDVKSAEFFIQQTVGEAMKIKAMVQQAVDHKIITFDGKQKSWFYLNSEGRPSAKILSIGPKDNRLEKLADFLAQIDKDRNVEHIESLLSEALQEDKKGTEIPTESLVDETIGEGNPVAQRLP